MKPKVSVSTKVLRHEGVARPQVLARAISRAAAEAMSSAKGSKGKAAKSGGRVAKRK